MSAVEFWVDGSRACQLCGVVVVDGSRSVHEAFHGRVDPLATPGPEPEPEA